ncbi:hypothetical protein P7C70_g9003, partial [Phenoliferia sp. Uapishka_3]
MSKGSTMGDSDGLSVSFGGGETIGDGEEIRSLVGRNDTISKQGKDSLERPGIEEAREIAKSLGGAQVEIGLMGVQTSLTMPIELRFKRNNTSSFLRRYNLIMDGQEMDEKQRCHLLPLHLPDRYAGLVYGWPEWLRKDWIETSQRMKDEFFDEDRNKYVASDLYKIALKAQSNKIQSSHSLITYHRRFTLASRDLKNRELVSWQEESRIFLQGFPSKLRTRWEDESRRARKQLSLVMDRISEGQDGRFSLNKALSEEEREVESRRLRRLRVGYAKIATIQEVFDGVLEILEDDEILRRQDYGMRSKTWSISSEDETDSAQGEELSSGSESEGHDDVARTTLGGPAVSKTRNGTVSESGSEASSIVQLRENIKELRVQMSKIMMARQHTAELAYQL